MTTLKSNPVLQDMLDRLFAALVNGPSLNARPHSSRQRIDFTQFAKLKDRSLEEVMSELLGEQREARIKACVPPPPKKSANDGGDEQGKPEESPEQKLAQEAFADQQAVLNKCRGIAEDAKAYENDTGVHVLHIGFPILSLPPGSFGGKGLNRRILAPVCLISLSLSVRGMPNPLITLECRNEGADLVVPNTSLLAWLENQTGREMGELDSDEAGERPWNEVAQIVGHVAHMLNMPVPEEFASEEALMASLALRPCPRADDDASPRLISSAVVGLFPLANQGLIRDTQAVLAGEAVAGPIEHFVSRSPRSEAPTPDTGSKGTAAVAKRTRRFAEERLVTQADPCQTRAVMLARVSKGLVVHGPPGTGKSQTIANIIGDHLARGERVLFVCDKRTALDVVMNRLEAMGISSLCAVVHDPRRDQRDLYKAIREQLDNLPDLRTSAGVEKRLSRLDDELQKLHAELTEYHAALIGRPDADTGSFHELMGQWLALPAPAVDLKEDVLAGVSVGQLEEWTQPIHELFERGAACAYPENPWVKAAGMSLADFLATPMDTVRARVQNCLARARAADATVDDSIPPFLLDENVIEAGEARVRLANAFRQFTAADRPVIQRWLRVTPQVVQQQAHRLGELAAQIELVAAGPLPLELSAALGGTLPPLATINQQIMALDQYLRAVSGFWGFLAFGKKKAAAQILAIYGLPLRQEHATRVGQFLAALKARLLLQDLVGQLTGAESSSGLLPDTDLLGAARLHSLIFAALQELHTHPHLKSLAEPLAKAVTAQGTWDDLLAGLARSPDRAQALAGFETDISSAGFFADRWIQAVGRYARSGKVVSEQLTLLQDYIAKLENVLRIREGLTRLPAAIGRAAEQLLGEGVDSEVGLVALRKSALALEITARLRTDSRLHSADSQVLQSCFKRYLELDLQKKALARELIVHVWGTRQKERLLATTGSRLNGAGADLRRRFMLRGERAMRLRQVIAVGQSLPEEDPLFDLRPIWMASPETVAQIFPRKPLFDVVVFDEASQCRLEEALPVLLRGRRVVIAGDPKQLPPTRFFESTVAVSEQDEIETDQQLFEAQQGEIEDLLGAALNTEIDECYLDVHYRSRNSDLIEFSNRHFYGARLQPIPGHPSHRSRFAPLTLYRSNGVYKDRQNEKEAEQVSQIVRDLLRRAAPPSIGIACFNINQRDLILEKLEELAASDASFAGALAQAWSRRTNGQFDGLFVKNLENVQGDERDHLIISTTYGPDPAGRFYRRFGPLGRAGGGRRLNVLVTRARNEVHLVTSIPEAEYRHLPPIPAGQAPGGPWLLFSYLRYAELLAQLYEDAHEALAAEQAHPKPSLRVLESHYPSEFCKVLGQELVAAHKTGSDVFWGNDGFCIDLALRHPHRCEDVTIGVLCDTNRFGLAADPVEWEVFRTCVLESQGWKLHRLWTPSFFRDRRGCLEAIAREVDAFLAAEKQRDSVRMSDDESAD